MNTKRLLIAPLMGLTLTLIAWLTLTLNLFAQTGIIPQIIINEIMKHPTIVNDNAGEWFELYNADINLFDLNGCTLKDGGIDSHVIDNGGPLIINPGAYLILGNNGDPGTNGGVNVDYVYTGFQLSNLDDEIILECAGVEVDRVDYDDGITFPDPSGAAMQLLAPTLDNNLGANWCEATSPWPGSAGDRGTPGAPNVCSADLALSKRVNASLAVPEQSLAYTLIYTNNGSYPARGVLITDEVPTALVNYTFSNSGAMITPTGGLNYVWLVQDLAPGEGGIITIIGELSTPLARDFIFTNAAEIVTAIFDSDQTNNTGEAQTTVSNVPPQASNDTRNTTEDTPLTLALLANDSDLNGDNLTLATIGVPANGIATPQGDAVVYTPALNFNGIDNFTYSVSDDLLTDTAAVTVIVAPVNDAPQAISDMATTAANTPVVIAVLNNDSDVDGALVPASVMVISGPGSGSASVDSVTGEITYTPDPGFSGSDSFAYEVCDDGAPLPAQCATATVAITINAAAATICAATPDDGITVYPAVQQAVDAANPGDTVKVAGYCAGAEARAGLVQTVYISQPLTIRGGYTVTDWVNSHPITQPTTLDALMQGRVIIISGTGVNVTIENLTVMHGVLDENVCPASCGGGILLTDNAQSSIQAVILQGNQAYWGGGLYADTGSLLTLDATTFLSNTSILNGGGLVANETFTITNSLFENNKCAASNCDGGGLYLGAAFNTPILTLVKTSFISNTARGNGGGAWVAGRAIVTGGRFERNHVDGGTTAFSDGGGGLWAGELRLTGTQFISNTSGEDGGGLLVRPFLISSTATLTNAYFAGNEAASNGGGFAFTGFANPVLTTKDSQFISNTAARDGGGAWANSGVIATTDHFEGNVSLGGSGGGVRAPLGELIFDNTTFLSNSALVDGGGAHSFDAMLVGGRFENNVAQRNGGGLRIDRRLTLTDPQFINNSAADVGGGVMISQTFGGAGRLVNGLFARNRAGANGASLYLNTKRPVDILHATIASPTIVVGQAIYVDGGMANITNTIIASHTTGIEQAGNSSVNENYNLFFNTPTATTAGVNSGGNSFVGNPVFLNPANDDYHLTFASAALDAGMEAGVTADFEGDVRPQGPGPDVGYDEFLFRPQADLGISKVVNSSTAAPAETITCTIVFSNAGLSTAAGVVITDIVPPYLTNLLVVVGGVTITPTGSLTYVWQVQDLGLGAGGVITITGELISPLPRGFVFTNTAQITTTTSGSQVNNHSAAVAVTVANARPQAVDDSDNTDEDTIIPFTVLANDNDLNGDNLTLTTVSNPANGTTIISGDAVIYTPALNFNGPDTFTYIVSDGLLTDTATVTITVNALNDPPQFTSSADKIAIVGLPYGYTSIATDVDVGDHLILTALTLPAWLTLSDHGDGTATLEGIPTATDVGDQMVVLQVSDGQSSDTQSFTLTVKMLEPTATALYLPLVIKSLPPTPPDLIVTELIAASDAVTVVIKNVGGSPVIDAFWVDVYIDPVEPLSLNVIWPAIAEQGLAWGITDPIPAGGELTLTVGDDFYFPTESDFSSLAPGTPVWALVDSINLETTFGAVLESDEGNNIFGPANTTARIGDVVIEAPTHTFSLTAREGGLPARR